MKRYLLPNLFHETYPQWPRMNMYERFEQSVAIVLSFIISIVVLIALFELIGKVAHMLVAGAFDPLDHEVFQSVFGAIMTLLIAMEFKHSIIRVIERRESIIQVKTVVLIAIMALARKFIILDASTKDAAMLAALAAVMLALGVVYWLMRDNSQTARMEDVNKPKLHAVHAMAIKEDGEQRHG